MEIKCISLLWKENTQPHIINHVTYIQYYKEKKKKRNKERKRRARRELVKSGIANIDRM